MTKLPAVASQPLSIEILETRPKAFSTRILAGLSKNPIFQPKLKRDGFITDHDLLTIANTILSAADERIEELERKSSVLNGPMFAGKSDGANDDEGSATTESNWFSQYLTLRNFLSVALVVITGLWGFFTYTTSDKNWQLESKQRDIDSLQKDKKQFQDDTKYWQDETERYKKVGTDAAQKEGELNVKYQSLKATEDAERKELEAARSQITKLTNAVGKQADAAAK